MQQVSTGKNSQSMNLDQWVNFLKSLDVKPQLESWKSGLSERKLAELTFHDKARGEDDWDATYDNKKYYDTCRKSADYRLSWIHNNSKGKVVLDYACGEGDNALEAAASGATLAIGIDISPVAIESARAKAVKRGLADKTFFLVGDAENTRLPNDSLDTIICSGCLHHLDLSYAFPELRRILKPGGKLFALEGLAINPVISLYRHLTPEVRTAWEKDHILSVRDLRFASRFFEVTSVKYFHLFSLLVTPLRKTPFFGPLLGAADGIDSLALKLPLIKYLAWQFTFELGRKPVQ